MPVVLSLFGCDGPSALEIRWVHRQLAGLQVYKITSLSKYVSRDLATQQLLDVGFCPHMGQGTVKAPDLIPRLPNPEEFQMCGF